MAKISVDHKSSISAPDAIQKIKTFFETDPGMKKLDSKIQCVFVEGALTGKVNGSQFKADVLAQSEGTGSKVTVIIDLPFILTPFKGKIEEDLRKKLSKHLA